MADYYKLVGSKENSTVDWTTEVVLERGDDGEVTKAVGVNRPAQLSKADLDKLEELGYETEGVSKEEAEQAEAAVAVGEDVAAAAPLLGEGTTKADSESTSKKTN